MRIISGFALLGLAATFVASTTTTNSTATKTKRWLSVPTYPGGGSPDTIGPWPIGLVDPIGGNEQYVYYCYANEQSATNLQDIVTAAIKIWQPAFQHSSLDIQVDPDCINNQGCLCSDLPAPVDALVIQDMGALPSGQDPDYSEGDDEENGDGPTNTDCQTRATTGYDYTNIDDSMRHTLKFCGFNSDDASDPTIWNEWVLEIAHELGHAVGFEHEHQRTDRDDWLIYSCANLIGYSDAEDIVEDSDDAAFDGIDSIEDRMNLVCGNYALARIYFPEAIPYLKASALDSYWQAWLNSWPLDYYSIMIYSSYQMSNSKDLTFPAGAVLIGDPPGVDETLVQFWQGGNSNAEYAALSSGDLARVAQLYDKGTQDGTTAMNTATWSTKAPEVKRTAAPNTVATVTKA